jgi:pilus assembly protein CpaF
MIKIVLNRSESLGGISVPEIKLVIPVDIIFRIPSEGKVAVTSINKGIPAVIDASHSKLSTALRKFTHEIVTNDSIYIVHEEIANLRVSKQELPYDKTAGFWKEIGLVEAVREEIEEDEIINLKKRIHQRLIEELNLKRLDLRVFSNTDKKKELCEKAEKLVGNLLAEETKTFISSLEVRKKLVKEIIDEALGLGPLEDLLNEPDITDIMVNNKDEIYVERRGKIELTSKKFISNEQVKTVIDRIIAPLGRRVDESIPYVDARLPDGSRINAILPPLSLTGPTLTIRKFAKQKLTMDDLIKKYGSTTKEMAEFLAAAVKSRKNILVSGGTGSGKTTLLNILSLNISSSERIITIEDAAELKLNQTHWIRLESRPPNIEGKGEIGIRELFRNSLRMRPDRIIVGEVRGKEVLDMLHAMNTGHDGSMSTIHANSTHDVLIRLDTMILMSGIELPLRAIREMIASALDLIIHTARLSDGSRKIVQITEVTGMKTEVDVDLKDIFIFKQEGIDKDGKVLGYFTPTGYIPTFFEEMKAKGISLSSDLFTPQK